MAENALKSFLYAQGEEMVIGPSVEALCRWASEYDSDFTKLCPEVAILDGYYTPTRYPNALPDSIPARIYNQRVTEEALRLARLTGDFVQGKLP
ncbi:MAG: HEPN domain-containing protein [Anaerolineae bacterium]